MCWVMPPYSRAATDVFRMASSRLVLPWSTCPITVTTGGRGVVPLASGSAATSRIEVTSWTWTVSGGLGAKLKAAMTLVATSRGIMWLTPAMIPLSTSFLMTSPTPTPIRAASSPTWMGPLTSRYLTGRGAVGCGGGGGGGGAGWARGGSATGFGGSGGRPGLEGPGAGLVPRRPPHVREPDRGLLLGRGGRGRGGAGRLGGRGSRRRGALLGGSPRLGGGLLRLGPGLRLLGGGGGARRSLRPGGRGRRRRGGRRLRDGRRLRPGGADHPHRLDLRPVLGLEEGALADLLLVDGGDPAAGQLGGGLGGRDRSAGGGGRLGRARHGPPHPGHRLGVQGAHVVADRDLHGLQPLDHLLACQAEFPGQLMDLHDDDPPIRSRAARHSSSSRSVIRRTVGARGEGGCAMASRRAWTSSSGMGLSRAPDRRPSRSARSTQASWGHTYAPRPATLPVGSTRTSPEGVRTTRTSSRFGRISPQATHCRFGTCRTFGIGYSAAVVSSTRGGASTGRSPPGSPACAGSGSSSGRSAKILRASISFSWDSLLMSMRHPVSLAASRAFWPSLPMASESWLSGTITRAVLVSSLISTRTTLAGLSAFATKVAGSLDHGTMSIFSPRSSSTMDCTRDPLGPTQAPTASTLRSRETTATSRRAPASRAMALISTIPP